jgi:surfeit locus 1 family protein
VNLRRLPLLPTLIVAAAAAAMIALGFWQISRAHWKESLLERYAAADGQPPIAYPASAMSKEDLPLYRRASGLCLRVVGWRALAGQDNSGEPGYSHLADCSTGAEGPGMVVDAGWSKDPNARPKWSGGPVAGVIAPDRKAGLRLVSAQGLGGLAASAPPSTESIPNNHRFYAAQWFFFAAAAMVIYALALRKRLRAEDS